ncbi:MAG: aconitase X swivel domain-containing protein [Candidatus Acetothermia bacterium]
MSCRKIVGKFYLEASVAGTVIKSNDPMSFWGGYDPSEGRVIDRRNEVYGEKVAGKIFVFPEGIGSSTTAAVLLESVRNQTNPIGIVNVKTEPILLTGALIARELYGVEIPIVTVDPGDFAEVEDGDVLKIDADDRVLRRADESP